MDLQQFYYWQQAEPRRSVQIELGDPSDDSRVKVWVYSWQLLVGQHVKDVSEIDLEAVKDEQDKREYEKLKRKFEAAFGEVR